MLQAALQTEAPDFEDAVLLCAGQAIGINGVVTRNSKDFEHADVPVYELQQLVALLQATYSSSE